MYPGDTAILGMPRRACQYGATPPVVAGEVGVTSDPEARRHGRRAPQPRRGRAERLAPVPEPTRAGEDARRRGWFWHWNAIVTQYAPLIGLKGVGLLNSYTVWTDRREESPHRGYAFPSQQSEADFYGEDRAELITINKILVALDLIEIRKEMVLRADEQGRRWRVPHNFYRVKDHGDGFTLTTRDVLRVVELADRRPGGLPLRPPHLLAALRPDRRRQRLGPHPAGGAPAPGLAAPRGPRRRRGGPRLGPHPGRPRRAHAAPRSRAEQSTRIRAVRHFLCPLTVTRRQARRTQRQRDCHECRGDDRRRNLCCNYQHWFQRRC